MWERSVKCGCRGTDQGQQAWGPRSRVGTCPFRHLGREGLINKGKGSRLDLPPYQEGRFPLWETLILSLLLCEMGRI